MTRTEMDNYIKKFMGLFDELQSTSSRQLKEFYVARFKAANPGHIEDLTTIFETLANKHPIGWTFTPRYKDPQAEFSSVQEMINFCIACPKDQGSTYACENIIGYHGIFLAPIVNRTLRLGIGQSLLQKSVITPMLAKKYNGEMLHNDVAATEKLDGNRCIARYDADKKAWVFTSRSGKILNVNFDMSGLPKEFIFDGEIMSKEQTRLSLKRSLAIITDEHFDYFPDSKNAQLLFNKTSGLINSKFGDKSNLVYNAFDIVSELSYTKRREFIDEIGAKLPTDTDVRVVPVLYEGTSGETITNILYRITQMGGEGVMLNRISARYEHKRTDALLKYKTVQFMDMRVTGIFGGNGKYEHMCGGLHCYARTDAGLEILADVGSGLSDAQRAQFYAKPSTIVGKIVEVGYHELTQSLENRGTKIYSLRFPRLMRVRNDKSETSEY